MYFLLVVIIVLCTSDLAIGQCGDDEYECSTLNGTIEIPEGSQCIDATFVCDYDILGFPIPDCPLGDDEWNCTKCGDNHEGVILLNGSTVTVNDYVCPSTGICIPWEWSCANSDTIVDCWPNQEDVSQSVCEETNANYIDCGEDFVFTEGDPCFGNKAANASVCFKCDNTNGRCIPLNFTCDGIIDCLDGQDESTTMSPNCTLSPTSLPTNLPTAPTINPSVNPTSIPSSNPTNLPSNQPTDIPSSNPTAIPTTYPSSVPSNIPSNNPSTIPTVSPTIERDNNPTGIPSDRPSMAPTDPTANPSTIPSNTPSDLPTTLPSSDPTKLPTVLPSGNPTLLPTQLPSDPTGNPTVLPSNIPSTEPTDTPNSVTTDEPTSMPTISFTEGECCHARENTNRYEMFCNDITDRYIASCQSRMNNGRCFWDLDDNECDIIEGIESDFSDILDYDCNSCVPDIGDTDDHNNFERLVDFCKEMDGDYDSCVERSCACDNS